MHNLKSREEKGGEAQREDEVFDVVDAEDRVIGQATRGEVHRRGWWHRAVHVWVFDGDGRLFLQKRSMAKDTAPGRWDSSCSGHLDAGETYEAAVRRELGEEIGVGPGEGEGPVYCLGLTPCEGTGWEFVRVYRLGYGGPFRLHSAEIEEGRWFTRAEVAARVAADPEAFTSAFRLILERMGEG